MSLIATLLGGPLGGILGKVASKHFPDEDKRAAFETELKLTLLENDKELSKAGSDVVMAEVQSGGLAALWRPILMMVFVAVIALHYLVHPVIGMFVTLPEFPLDPKVWDLMLVGVGGYTFGRTGEKMVETYVANKK